MLKCKKVARRELGWKVIHGFVVILCPNMVDYIVGKLFSHLLITARFVMKLQSGLILFNAVVCHPLQETVPLHSLCSQDPLVADPPEATCSI